MRIDAPRPLPIAASSRGPKPASEMGAKTSAGTPESGSGSAKGTVSTRVVEIAARPPRAMVMAWPALGPTTRNIEPSARNGMLRTPPNRKKTRYAGPLHPSASPAARAHVARANIPIPVA